MNKSAHLHIRATLDLLSRIKRAADQVGAKSVSAWITQVLSDAANRILNREN